MAFFDFIRTPFTPPAKAPLTEAPPSEPLDPQPAMPQPNTPRPLSRRPKTPLPPDAKVIDVDHDQVMITTPQPRRTVKPVGRAQPLTRQRRRPTSTPTAAPTAALASTSALARFPTSEARPAATPVPEPTPVSAPKSAITSSPDRESAPGHVSARTAADTSPPPPALPVTRSNEQPLSGFGYASLAPKRRRTPIDENLIEEVNKEYEKVCEEERNPPPEERELRKYRKKIYKLARQRSLHRNGALPSGTPVDESPIDIDLDRFKPHTSPRGPKSGYVPTIIKPPPQPQPKFKPQPDIPKPRPSGPPKAPSRNILKVQPRNDHLERFEFSGDIVSSDSEEEIPDTTKTPYAYPPTDFDPESPDWLLDMSAKLESEHRFLHSHLQRLRATVDQMNREVLIARREADLERENLSSFLKTVKGISSTRDYDDLCKQQRQLAATGPAPETDIVYELGTDDDDDEDEDDDDGGHRGVAAAQVATNEYDENPTGDNDPSNNIDVVHVPGHSGGGNEDNGVDENNINADVNNRDEDIVDGGAHELRNPDSEIPLSPHATGEPSAHDFRPGDIVMSVNKSRRENPEQAPSETRPLQSILDPVSPPQFPEPRLVHTESKLENPDQARSGRGPLKPFIRLECPPQPAEPPLLYNSYRNPLPPIPDSPTSDDDDFPRRPKPTITQKRRRSDSDDEDEGLVRDEPSKRPRLESTGTGEVLGTMPLAVAGAADPFAALLALRRKPVVTPQDDDDDQGLVGDESNKRRLDTGTGEVSASIPTAIARAEDPFAALLALRRKPVVTPQDDDDAPSVPRRSDKGKHRADWKERAAEHKDAIKELDDSSYDPLVLRSLEASPTGERASAPADRPIRSTPKRRKLMPLGARDDDSDDSLVLRPFGAEPRHSSDSLERSPTGLVAIPVSPTAPIPPSRPPSPADPIEDRVGDDPRSRPSVSSTGHIIRPATFIPKRKRILDEDCSSGDELRLPSPPVDYPASPPTHFPMSRFPSPTLLPMSRFPSPVDPKDAHMGGTMPRTPPGQIVKNLPMGTDVDSAVKRMPPAFQKRLAYGFFPPSDGDAPPPTHRMRTPPNLDGWPDDDAWLARPEAPSPRKMTRSQLQMQSLNGGLPNIAMVPMPSQPLERQRRPVFGAKSEDRAGAGMTTSRSMTAHRTTRDTFSPDEDVPFGAPAPDWHYESRPRSPEYH